MCDLHYLVGVIKLSNSFENKNYFQILLVLLISVYWLATKSAMCFLFIVLCICVLR